MHGCVFVYAYPCVWVCGVFAHECVSVSVCDPHRCPGACSFTVVWGCNRQGWTISNLGGGTAVRSRTTHPASRHGGATLGHDGLDWGGDGGLLGSLLPCPPQDLGRPSSMPST